jgi:lipid-A-disaccharide synthase
MSKTLFFSVGEPSGDQHAARLIRAISKRSIAMTDRSSSLSSGKRPLFGPGDLRVRGFGGPEMRAAGCQMDLNLTEHAVVGLVEVLPKLRQFFSFVDQAEAIFKAGSVDGVVLVDFPGFNWHIAKRAKKYGLPVYYYCPPQLWAWGGWRIGKLRRTVDHVLAVLPIEQRYFEEKKVPVTYVGHPFFDAVEQVKLDVATMNRFESISKTGDRLIAVLPGSRGGEVEKNWPVMLQSMRELSGRHQDIRFLVACHRDRHALQCREKMTEQDQGLPIEIFVARTSEIIEAAHCAMMVSGSVSLELMARRTPAAVLYRVSRSLHFVASRLVHLDSITLPNLMAQRRIFPEMVSVGDPGPAVDFLSRSMDAFLNDTFYYQSVLKQLDDLRAEYCLPGASEAAAQWLVEQALSPGMAVSSAQPAPTPLRQAG